MLYMNFHTQNQEISTVRGFYYYYFYYYFIKQYCLYNVAKIEDISPRKIRNIKKKGQNYFLSKMQWRCKESRL